MSADIGLVGLAVMGENLVLNIEKHGYTVAVFNRTTSKVDEFLSGRGNGLKFVGTHSLGQLCASLKKPRKVILLVKAGEVVDSLIAELVPLLSLGDIIIDGGNSHHLDSTRRTKQLRERGLHFIGLGVSSGEECALTGVSLNPGGDAAAWPSVKPIFQAISAKLEDGTACCKWVGDGGAGHFVKMLHNGFEYADMQIICESYHIMRDVLSLSNNQMAAVFRKWKRGDLNSYLIEITADILEYTDEGGAFLIDCIMDKAGQKGTGKWTSIEALDLGIPLTVISEAVFARCLSALKEDRIEAKRVLSGPASPTFVGDKARFLEDLRKTMYCAKVTSYAQGFMMMRAVAAEYKWDLRYGEIALMWRGGSIISSPLLSEIKTAFDRCPGLRCLLVADAFKAKVNAYQDSWRKVVSVAALQGIPTPCIAATLAFYDGYRCERLPANLLQAQRDYFGAHTYERVDRPAGVWEHTNWTGRGGATAASNYNV